MNNLRVLLLLLFAVSIIACAGPRLEQRRSDARSAIEALRRGDFPAAEREATKAIKVDEENSHARLVAAITRYKKTMHQLSTDVRTVIFGAFRAGGFNHRYMRSSLQQTAAELARVDQDLAAASVEGIDLELCLACWKVDWNHNGRVDEMDERLFQMELDARGEPIPGADPRRRPTFRFDYGDVAWARAFVGFQRAALNILMAYEWTEVDKVFLMVIREMPTIKLRIARPELIEHARRQILEALEHADRARRAYLAERDDDREWIPSPRQKSHPMPLPVDDALYETWEQIVGDLQRLVRGEEGLSVAAVAQLGDRQWESPPRGYVDIGRMLARPKDIVLNIAELFDLERTHNVEGMLRSILGEYYVPQMKASPITGRLDRMKKEVERGKESLERKLRYLIWLN